MKRAWVRGSTLKRMLRVVAADRALLAPGCGDEIPTRHGRVFMPSATAAYGQVYQGFAGSPRRCRLIASVKPEGLLSPCPVAKKYAPTVLPLWDLLQPGDSIGPYGGIWNRALGVYVREQIGNGQWLTNVYAGWGVYLRVKTWRLNASLTVDFGSSTMVGNIVNFDMEAGQYPATETPTPLPDERFICTHGGWYGETEITGWTLTGGDDGPVSFDPGPLKILLWPQVEHPVTDVEAEYNEVFVFGQPEMHFLELEGYSHGVIFGKSGGEEGCALTGTLPATHDGSFDGTSLNTFALKLGGPVPTGIGPPVPTGELSGTGTLTPHEFWPYDPGDGLGPIYDTGSGSWLRTPPGF